MISLETVEATMALFDRRLRMMRSGGFTPLDLSPSLWLDSSVASSLFQTPGGSAATANNDPVGQWQDQSGNARHAEQSTGSFRPTLKLSIQNGLPVIRFGGGDDFLSCGNVCNLGTGSMTIYAVNAYATTGDGSLVAKSKAAAGAGRYAMFRETGNMIGLYDPTGTAATAAVADSETNTFRMSAFAIDRTAGVLTLYKNGSSVATQSFTPESTNHNTTTRLLIGAYGNSTDTGEVLYLTGDICEVLIIPSILSAGQKALLDAYLNAKWAIY